MPKQTIGLVLALIAIGGLIYYSEAMKPGRAGAPAAAELTASREPAPGQQKNFPRAKEIVSPAGFINTEPLQLQPLVGQQVILVDFWTYSCINCQRTLPYLNAWYEKYRGQGLTIVGVHTPEFSFEKERANVQAATDKFGVKYPVVLDNDYATWQAYGNRYWPRKYLIDIDGYIVYDHIGEGAYEETEQKIQELLQERAQRLGSSQTIDQTLAQPAALAAPADAVTPEIYFGSLRNEYLGNGRPFTAGPQELAAPEKLPLNKLILAGQWNFAPEFASNTSPASIILRYQAKDVYFVAAADTPVTVRVLRDGQPLGSAAGEEVQQSGSESAVTIQPDRLYKLVSDSQPGEHTLELRLTAPGLKAYTFTFG